MTPFSRLEIDERAREVRVDGIQAKLKRREFALLVELDSACTTSFAPSTVTARSSRARSGLIANYAGMSEAAYCLSASSHASSTWRRGALRG